MRFVVLAGVAALMTGSAHAASSPTEAPAVLQASERADAAFGRRDPAAGSRQVCRPVSSTGTRLVGRQVCRTARAWEARRQLAQQDVERLRLRSR